MEYIKKKEISSKIVANFQCNLVANNAKACKSMTYRLFCGLDGTRTYENI